MPLRGLDLHFSEARGTEHISAHVLSVLKTIVSSDPLFPFKSSSLGMISLLIYVIFL